MPASPAEHATLLELPAPLSVATFLERHWQKAPLVLPGALPPGLPALCPDELAWLATQPDVEARLVTTERHGARENYRVRHGPFAEDELTSLPQRDWTLLVHDVDKHLPDFRAWFDVVPFIPDWRIDDLMVSCAAPGGSVGPHRDHYDVFLCQGSGRREWRLAGADAVLHEIAGGELSVLEPFAADPCPVRDGDILYLPPGIAHWGVAMERCVTYSIGMRAPTRRELLSGLQRELGRTGPPPGSADRYYADPDLARGEARPGGVSRAALSRAATLLGDAAPSSADLARVLLSVVTDPKAWLAPDGCDADAVLCRIQSGLAVPVHGMARLAWCETAGGAFAGANGFVCRIDDRGLQFMMQLCRSRSARSGDRELLGWLAERGAFDIVEPSE